LDDVLVFSESLEDHKRHVKTVCRALREAGLYLDIDKCQFAVTRVKYLGLILTTEGIEMDPDKIKVLTDWALPTNVREVQLFLGFTNFYRCFIIAYSELSRALTDLTREGGGKNFPLHPDSEAARAFDNLKKAFTEATMLAHFDVDLETWIETDASDYVIIAILSQIGRDCILRPVAFLSSKMSPAECNYAIYDKELMAIVRAFEEWRPELSDTGSILKVVSDHRTLEWFMTTKKLNCRQARWAEFLSEFNFRITYRPGKQGGKPDALTRRPGDLPQGVSDDREKHQTQMLLTRDHLDSHILNELRQNRDDSVTATMVAERPDKGAFHAAYLATFLIDYTESVVQLASMVYLMSEEFTEGMTADGDSLDPGDDEPRPASHSSGTQTMAPRSEPWAATGITTRLKELSAKDEVIQEIISAKRDGLWRLPRKLIHDKGLKIELQDCEVTNGLLYVRERIFVPNDDDLRNELLLQHHDPPATGHGGHRATYYSLSQEYYWLHMTDSVATYTRECVQCRRSKPFKEQKQGLLRPLPVPKRFWTDISVDFITPLPKCTRNRVVYKHIMVVVDRLSKAQKFIALPTLEVEDVVRAFIEYVWREEGFPDTIVSDRGSQFTSFFWRELCKRIGATPRLTTAYHPKANGQTEIANAGLKCYLRSYVNFTQNDWVDWLPIAQLATNCRKNASTGIAPALATKAYLPRRGVGPDLPIDAVQSRAKRLGRKAA
jgi:hypothetical protein